MNDFLSFFVAGTPKPQGSSTPMVSRSTGKAFLKTSPALAQWRNTVVDRALDAIADAGWERVEDAPVQVTLGFEFQRPKSHSKKRRESDNGWHYNRPDLDKLVRAVIDGLTVAGVWQDDGQVSAITTDKSYDSRKGVYVTVERLDR